MVLRSVIARIPAADRGVFAAMAAAFAFLILAGVAAVVAAAYSAEGQRWVAHTQEVRQVNLRLLSTMEEAVLGERGYLLTHKRVYLDGCRRSVSLIPAQEKYLRAITHDNSHQWAREQVLFAAITAETAELDQALAAAAKHDGSAAAAVESGQLVVNPMLPVHNASDAIDAAEARLLAVRQNRATWQRWALIGAIIASLVASGVLVLFVLTSTRRNLALLADRNEALAHEMERRLATEAQLRQAQKMEALGQLTGGVAHDFNNMLAIVIGNLDLLGRRMGESVDAKLRSFVDNALEGAQRAAALTQSLLAFSRQQPLDPKPVDVNKAVADMSRLFRRTLGEGVTVETVLAGGLWPGFIDGPQLESAMLNLAVNARDAMPGGGKLTIETANTYLDESYAENDGTVAAGQYVLVAFSDTGTGMPPEIAARVFDPFFTTKDPGKGTGLGLSQVHGFLKQSRGHVKIYSEPGMGTTVKLYLPRADGHGTAETATADGPAERPAPGQATVLVVEDDASVRAFASDALRDLGYDVIEADGVPAALEQLDTRPQIALILTDVVMPGASGRVLADAARAKRPGLPVVFMTGYTRNAIVHNGVLDAGSLLLTKPFTMAQLAAKLKQALAG
jgi:signal transduction histidine kinase